MHVCRWEEVGGGRGTKWFTWGYNRGQNIEPIGRSGPAGEHWDTCVQTERGFFQSRSPYEEHLAASFKMQSGSAGSEPSPQSKRSTQTHGTGPRPSSNKPHMLRGSRSSWPPMKRTAINQWSGSVDRKLLLQPHAFIFDKEKNKSRCCTYSVSETLRFFFSSHI